MASGVIYVFVGPALAIILVSRNYIDFWPCKYHLDTQDQIVSGSWCRSIRAIRSKRFSFREQVYGPLPLRMGKWIQGFLLSVQRERSGLIWQWVDQVILCMRITSVCSKSIDRSIDRSINQSINQSISQSVGQSVNQSTNQYRCSSPEKKV